MVKGSNPSPATIKKPQSHSGSGVLLLCGQVQRSARCRAENTGMERPYGHGGGETTRERGEDVMPYEYDAVLRETEDNGGAYVAFPWDIREEFGRGRVKVRAWFDGVPYDGSIVNMGVRNADGSICYIIGVRKAIRAKLGKGNGDTIHVRIEPAETGEST